MRHRSWLIAALLSIQMAFGAKAPAPRWIRAQSPNFEVYSTADEAGVRDTLLQFEQLRAFFQRQDLLHSENAAPVRIVAFRTAKEYEGYRPNDFAVAFYFSGVERDTIVMTAARHTAVPATDPVAIHEYFHLVLNRLGLKLPLWLDEGLAELYSTLRPWQGRAVLGELIPSRVHGLRTDKWTPLAEILSADSSSPFYSEKSKAGTFYNEGWALTHMLYLSPEYRPRFADLLTAVAVGRDSADALTSVYGKPLAAIEKDLQAYLRGNRFRAVVFEAGMEPGGAFPEPEPAPSFDVRLILAELTQRRARNDVEIAGVRRQLDALATERPDRPEPHVHLAYLLWNGPAAEGEAAVQKEFATAFALGARSSKMLWDYGCLIEATQPSQAAAVFRRLLTIQPDRNEVSIELAGALLGDGQPIEAARILTTLSRGVSPEDAPRYFAVAAFVALRLGDRDQARTLAGKLLSAPSASPADRQRATQLLDYLK